MSTTTTPSPDNLLECELWRNRCAKLNESRHFSLCRMLGVKPAGLEQALLEVRTVGMTHDVRNVAALWLESENDLAVAMSLMETAEAIHSNRIYKELDE